METTVLLKNRKLVERLNRWLWMIEFGCLIHGHSHSAFFEVQAYRVSMQTANMKQFTHIINISYGGCSKVLSFFPGLSQDLREAFASFRAWGFTTVGENGFSLGLEAFKDSCRHVLCPLITDTLIAEEQEAREPRHFHVGVFLVGRNPP